MYNRKKELKLEVYNNINYRSREDKKSISGYIFIFVGGVVNYSSKKQSTVVILTTKKEYIAFIYIAKKIIWIQRLFNKLKRS